MKILTYSALDSKSKFLHDVWEFSGDRNDLEKYLVAVEDAFDKLDGRDLDNSIRDLDVLTTITIQTSECDFSILINMENGWYDFVRAEANGEVIYDFHVMMSYALGSSDRRILEVAHRALEFITLK